MPRANRSGWSASSTSRSASTTSAAGSTGSTACPTASYELIDYKTGERKSEAELESDLQLALYRLAAREAWDIEASTGSYYYVLDAEKVAAPTKPDDAERVERTVLAGRRGDPRPGLRAAPLADGLQLVRLPADLPGRRELSAARAQSPCWRRKRWNSRAIVSAEGRSSPSLELLDLLGLDPLDQLLDLRVGGDGAADLLLVARRFPPPARRPRRRSRSGPRAGAAAPAPPSGWGRRRRSGAPPPRARPRSIPTWRQQSWTTPTIPVGPS